MLKKILVLYQHTVQACFLIFGSFHQNDARFSVQCRSLQCTGNAVCILAYSACQEISNGLMLDQVLCDRDSLYQSIVNNLKANGTFSHELLTLEDIPNGIGKFIMEKQLVVSEILVDT